MGRRRRRRRGQMRIENKRRCNLWVQKGWFQDLSRTKIAHQSMAMHCHPAASYLVL